MNSNRLFLAHPRYACPCYSTHSDAYACLDSRPAPVIHRESYAIYIEREREAHSIQWNLIMVIDTSRVHMWSIFGDWISGVGHIWTGVEK